MLGKYGLDNLGNTCYLNTIIQTLSNLQLFRNFLLDDKYIPFLLDKIDNDLDLNSQINYVYNSIIYQFYRLINTIWSDENDSASLKPITLKKKLGLINEIFKNNEQHDVQEAFTIIIEQLHKELCGKINYKISDNPTNLENACLNFWAKEYSPIYNMFHGMYLNTKICLSCNNKTENYEPNLFLSLDIPEIINIDNFKTVNYIDIKCKKSSINIDNETKEKYQLTRSLFALTFVAVAAALPRFFGFRVAITY
jgi:ubiquitin C-terminal hydrolase